MNLAKKGYQVWCFTNIEDEKEILAEKEKLQLQNLHMVFVRLSHNLDKHLLNTDSKKIYFHYLLWQKKAATVAKKMHEEIHFNIGHHVTFGSLQQGTFLWKLKNIKIIFGPVGGGQEALPVLKEYFGDAWKIEKLRNFISKWTIKYNSNFKNTILKANHILVTNDDTLQMVKKVKNHQESKINFVPDTAVPPSMNDIEFIEKPTHPKLNLLWVGRFLPRKGLNLILDALQYVDASVDYSLTIVGGGEQYHLLDGWIEKYKIDRSKLTITGQIPFVKVIEYYRQSDVFIFCSLRDSFPAQLTEAMAFSLPVIVMDIHGASIGVPENCGIKVKVTTKENTIKGVAAAIEKMYTDLPYRKQLATNAFRYAKNNTWQNKVDMVTEKFYKQ
jgi:glycosyltransferase involved in cell wall biosynthesis